MNLAVNKHFMASSFDLTRRVGFDGPAEPRLIALWLTGYLTRGTYKMRMQNAQMKYIAALALMLNLGVATVYAQHQTIKMAVSGNAASSAVNLQQPNTATSEDNYAGNGTLGSFTFRDVKALTTSPQPSNTCSGPNMIAFSGNVGAGVFRFEDGSLLKVSLTQETDCIDLAAFQAHCVLYFQITGGTGRFKNATGLLTLTETVVPVLVDAFGNPVFFAATGEITGTVSGVAKDGDHDKDW
jgi:hypothetical protein